MKYLFVIFLLVITACARSEVSSQSEQKEISSEEKIAQVQKLLEVKTVENTQSGIIPTTKPITTATLDSGNEGTQNMSTQKVSEKVSEPIVSEEKDESQEELALPLPTQDTQEISGDSETFTPDELDVIENTSDAEIDELIDIIFKE